MAPAGKATQAEVRPIDANPGRVAARIRTLLDTRRALEEVPKLGDALKNTNAGLLREIGEVLRDPFFAGFLHRIDGVFEPDVVDGRSSFSAKTRQVFAVKSGVDAFLDIARRNFCEATEAAHELIRALRERTGLESPRLDYTATGMFQIKVTRSDFGRYSVNASHFDASLPTLHAIDTLGDDATPTACKGRRRRRRCSKRPRRAVHVRRPRRHQPTVRGVRRRGDAKERRRG